MHDLAHLPVGQEDVVPTTLGPEEAEAVLVAADDADHQLQAVQQAILVGTVQQQLAVADHRAKALGERLPDGPVLDPEAFTDATEAERLARLGERLEDEFPARDGVFVAARLLAETRIPILPA